MVCVIGDGALTGGMAYEGLNQAGALGVAGQGRPQRQRDEHLAERRRALHALLQRARLDPTLTKVRGELERGPGPHPRRGRAGRRAQGRHQAPCSSPGALFEALGFAYVGPVDGHDIAAVRSALRAALEIDRPVLVHVTDGQGQRLRAGRGRRRGHARRHAVRRRERQGRAAKSAGPPAYTEVFGARAGGRGRARPARGRHHRRDAEGHRHART